MTQPIIEPPHHAGSTEKVAAKAEVRKKRHVSPVWLIPILVGLVVVYVGVDQLRRRGKVVMVTFESADGLVPGETPLRYKNVQLGTVDDVRLSNDLTHVDVTLRVNSHESEILTDHARFWVVRPRFSGNVSSLTAGLQTIVSGAYIAVDPGLTGGTPKTAFKGLEDPPGVRSDVPGRTFVLTAQKLGNLSTGAPLFFHDLAAGEVLNVDAADGRSGAKIRIFVHAPFDNVVMKQTHFWNVSGLSVNMGPEGLHVELQSVQALLSGGIAFDIPKGLVDRAETPVPNDETFPLYDDFASSEAATYTRKISCVTYFKSSVQGLAPGSPVQMLGSTVGLVREIRLVPNLNHEGRYLARVAYEIQPERAGAEAAIDLTAEAIKKNPPRVFLDSVSLLTGQKAITLDSGTTHGAPPRVVKMEGEAIELPGEAGGIENVAVAMGHIAGKLEAIPFDDIGKNLNATLVSVQHTVGGQDLQKAIHELSETMAQMHTLVEQTNRGLSPALAKLPAMADQMQMAIENASRAFGSGGYGTDSDFQRNMERLMKQVTEAARSIRLFADFMERHPDSLIRGKSGATEK